MTDEAELWAAWSGAIGASSADRAAFDDVVGRHREPQRRYHGVRHVAGVVRHVHALAAEAGVADQGAVVAAAFFHDAVYEPRADDNEACSAALAERLLAGLGWPADRGRTVAAMIRATATHEGAGEPGRDIDTAVLLDADLAVLGSEPAAYQAYMTGVRAEYAHVDAAGWSSGRAAVLDALLARSSIYATAPARARWEARARANMAAERAGLAGLSGAGEGPA